MNSTDIPVCLVVVVWVVWVVVTELAGGSAALNTEEAGALVTQCKLSVSVRG